MLPPRKAGYVGYVHHEIGPDLLGHVAEKLKSMTLG
jgi:hypothetical protein